MNNAELLDEFCDNLWLEDGLSRNTLDSYRRDLHKFPKWMENQQTPSILQTTHADVQYYLAHLVTEQKAKPAALGVTSPASSACSAIYSGKQKFRSTPPCKLIRPSYRVIYPKP